MNDLIKRVINRSSAEGHEALCTKCDYEELRFAINNLTAAEKELIKFVFFKNNTVRTYANQKNMCYSTASQRKKVALTKLSKYINRLKCAK